MLQAEISRLEAMEIVTSWMREGLAQGIEQGEQAKQIEILKRMLAENLPIDLIARITGLSIEEIQQIASDRA